MMLDSVKLNKSYPLNTLASLSSEEIVEEQVGRCNSWEVGRFQMSSVRPITTTALKNTEPRLSALDPLENAPPQNDHEEGRSLWDPILTDEPSAIYRFWERAATVFRCVSTAEPTGLHSHNHTDSPGSMQ